MAKEYYTIATFKASRGNKWWRVNRNEEGDLSCTCPGWCRRVAKDGSRSCKHVRKVMEQGSAQELQVRARRSLPATKARKAKLGERRFRL